MPKKLNGFLTFSLRGVALLLSIVLVLWAGLGSPSSSLAQQPNGDAIIAEGQDWSSAERWAWSEIKQGNVADFNKHCGARSLDPKKGEDWQDDCRLLPSRFLVALLTKVAQDAVPFAGIRITGAQIVGDINLENAKLTRAIEISGSRIEGTITLRRARTDSVISLASSLLGGDFDAAGLHSKSDLYLRDGATLNGRLYLRSAKINSAVDLRGASIHRELYATSCRSAAICSCGPKGRTRPASRT